MSNNPYRSPQAASEDLTPSRRLRAPAVALLIWSLIGTGFSVMGGAYWIPHLYHPESTVSEHQLALQTIVFSAMNALVSLAVLAGAIAMFRQSPRWLALTGAWAAVIPLFGPCFILAIPFGAWALVVLFKPDVKDAFGHAK
jgi:hypothetical protein